MDNPPIQGPIFLIETNKISPNPHQPRRDFDETALRELANSIREFGILQPLIVTKLEKENETGTSVEYQLIAGERRWRASALLGLERVPAIIRNTNLEKDREAVANTIRLLNLPTPIQESISKNQISESQGRLLLSVPDLIQQQSLFDDLLKNNMSVRELKSRITRLNKPAEPESIQPTQTNNPENLFLQKQLEELLGTKVKVEKSGDSGKITIAFYSQEELQSLIQKLSSTGGENQPL